MVETSAVALYEAPLSASVVVTGAQTPEPTLRGHAIRDQLFNNANLENYQVAIQQVVARLRRRIGRVRQPFSGVHPQELVPAFQDIDLDRPCADLSDALNELEAIYLDDAVYFHEPTYMAHLNCPVAIPAIAAELIQASINTSVDTWDQSAGGTLIEQKLIDWTAARIGLGTAADGVFTSGGTQSNLMAMLVARDAASRRLWDHLTHEQGLHPEAGRLRIFTSAASHFSVQKAAALLGLGYDAVVPIATDDYHRMDAGALKQALAECEADGLHPMAVVATAGTTDFGSIDPIPAIADLCAERGIWLHVDAAYGGGLLVSTRHRRRLSGIERADSVTVDYHKSFLQPVSCSACLVRDRARLGCVTWHADYLNPLSQAAAGVPNLVDKSLQTTRRFDALKLWLSLRALGADALGDAFDRVMHLARQAYLLLLSDDAIEVLHQPQLSTLVFRYRPDQRLDDQQLDLINQGIRERLMRSGQALVAGTRVDGRCYLKFTLLNPAADIRHVQSVLRMIQRHGEQAHDALTGSDDD